jgi:hypothetical protein
MTTQAGQNTHSQSIGDHNLFSKVRVDWGGQGDCRGGEKQRNLFNFGDKPIGFFAIAFVFNIENAHSYTILAQDG